MAQPQTDAETPRAPRRDFRRIGGLGLRSLLWAVVLFPVAAMAMIVGVLLIRNEPIALPSPVVRTIQSRIASELGEGLQLEARGGYDIVLEKGLVPRLRARGLALTGVEAAPVLRAREAVVALDPAGLVRGRLHPRRLLVSGVDIAISRLPGAEDAQMPAWAGAPRSGSDLEPALAGLRAALAQPELAALQEARVLGLNIDLRDATRDRRVALKNAELALSRTDGAVVAQAQGMMAEYASALGAAEGLRPAGRVALRARLSESNPGAEIAASVKEVPARLVAAQSPALGWLKLLEAPVSGAFEVAIDPSGQMLPLRMQLSAGRGLIRPGGGARPIPLRAGQARLSYEPGERRISLDLLALDSRALRLGMQGHADLTGDDPLSPDALIGQFRISGLQADPAGVFESPARFDSGFAELRLQLAPLRLDIGQMSLQRGEERLSARGQLRAGEGGWSAALDFDASEVALAQLLALWPQGAAPVTRRWLAKNVTTGILHEARGALRLMPGAEPLIELSYGFRGAAVRVVRSLPLIEDGAGYATIRDNAHVLVVDRGRLTPPGDFGSVDVAGSELSVADIRERPPQGHVALHIDAPIPAALALLDQPPFNLMKKARRQPDMIAGHADILAQIDLPFVKSPSAEQVRFRVDGTLSDVVSKVLVRDKVLRAKRLNLRAEAGDGLRIGGDATLDGAPFSGEWTQLFGPRGKGRSHFSAQLEVTPASLRALKVSLPKGLLSGRGRAQLEVDLIKDKPGPFTVESDLRGLSLAIPQIGWSKPAATRGRLVARGTIPRRGVIAPPRIDRFDISAAGLSGSGDLALNPLSKGGGLARAKLNALSVGRWFDGSVILTGRGKGKLPGVEVTGGSLDLTRAPFRKAAPGAAGDSYSVALDRLTISRGLFLTGVSAEVSTKGGLSGRFSGALNGRGALSGRLSPGKGGRTAVRASSANAGAVLAALGLPDRARGGKLDLQLSPARGKTGHYDIDAVIRDMTVRGIPTLGQALTLGRAEAARQALAGPGLRFSSVSARLRLSPEAIEVTNATGISPELGISTAGLYLPGNKGLHLKGVIAPGGADPNGALFGFAYKLRGTATAPELTVNPASILAPGNLREAFRRPAPKLEDVRIRN